MILFLFFIFIIGIFLWAGFCAVADYEGKRKCPMCRKEISTKAKICPYCRSDISECDDK